MTTKNNNIRPLTPKDLNNMSIDEHTQKLYWNGKPISIGLLSYVERWLAGLLYFVTLISLVIGIVLGGKQLFYPTKAEKTIISVPVCVAECPKSATGLATKKP